MIAASVLFCLLVQDKDAGETQDFASSPLNRFKRQEHFRRTCSPCVRSPVRDGVRRGRVCNPRLLRDVWGMATDADIYRPSAVVHFANCPPEWNEAVRCACAVLRASRPATGAVVPLPCHTPANVLT